MQTSAIGVGTTGSTARASGFGTMQSEEFFKLLITEMQQQDPLEPAKTADMVNQISQIRSIELSQQLTSALTQMSQQQRTSGVSELIGKFITARTATAEGASQDVQGIVTGVRIGSDGKAVLELDTGGTVAADAVTHITTPEAVGAGQPVAQQSSTETAAGAAVGAANQVAADKQSQTARAPQPIDLLPWLSLEGSFRL